MWGFPHFRPLLLYPHTPGHHAPNGVRIRIRSGLALARNRRTRAVGELTHWSDDAQRAQERLEAKRVALGIGTRGEHARGAIQRGGRRVRCAGTDGSDGCGYSTKIRTFSGRRLRKHACPECGGRLRPANWAGFDQRGKSR